MYIQKCKSISKRVTAILLICVITFGFTYNNYTKAYAVAGEGILVAGGGIAVETALGWLLAVFGFTASSAIVYDNRDSIIEWCSNRMNEFTDFCENTYDKATIAVGEATHWLEQLAKGTLDKASDVYKAFKAWCTELIKGRNSDIIYNENVWYDNLDSDEIKILSSSSTIYNDEYTNGEGIVCENYKYIGFENECRYLYVNLTWSSFSNIPTTPVASVFRYTSDNNKFYMAFGTCSLDKFFVLKAGFPYKKISRSIDKTTHIKVPTEIKVGKYVVYLNFIDYHSFDNVDTAISTLKDKWIVSKINPQKIISTYGTTRDYKLLALTYLDYLGLLDSDNIFNTPTDIDVADKTQQIFERDGTLDAYDIVAPVGVDDDILSIPWQNIGAYDVDGVLDITDILDNPINVITDGIVVPVDTVEDKTIIDDVPIDDVIVDNTTYDDYTIKGLETVFPFCLPFDFIKFINCLSASPKAPRFEWDMDFLEDLGLQKYTIVIDLSTFNSVAEIMRKMELLAFIIGLIIATRSKFIRG